MMKKAVLIIRDGWGVSDSEEGNAVYHAKTPVYDLLKEECPHSLLAASGESVGLPKGMMGNSEVGHLNLGAGRVVNEVIVKINDSISNGSFFSNPALMKAINNCKAKNSDLHLIGLLQKSGVHSLDTHLFALLKLANDNGIVPKIHLISDGKDSPQRSVKEFLIELKEVISKYGGEIVTISGKDFAMDRGKRWDFIEKAYNCMVDASGRRAENVEHAIHTAYQNGENDYNLSPTVMGDFSGVEEGDSLIFFNFRLDCARELTKAFVDPKFNGFVRKRKDILFVCFAEYYHELENCDNVYIVEYPEIMKNILGSVISKNGLKQLRVAESEKEAHVTYFFNGEFETPYPNEVRLIIPSPKEDSNLIPQTSSYEIASAVMKKMENYDLVIVNLASADLCGHTGDFEATVKAVEVVDECVGKILNKVKELGYVALITADHGNCESMLLNGDKDPSHSINKVDLIVYNHECNLENGKLADVAPTLLSIMDLDIPQEMTGNVLIRKF